MDATREDRCGINLRVSEQKKGWIPEVCVCVVFFSLLLLFPLSGALISFFWRRVMNEKDTQEEKHNPTLPWMRERSDAVSE